MKCFSEKTRQRMSESAKKRCSSPEWIAAQKARGTNLELELFKTLYYDRNMTQAEVAKEMGVTQKIVFAFMRRHGLPARPSVKRNQWRENNSFWKGGRKVLESNYVEVYLPEHPKARRNGYVKEHIVVAEKMLGRPLKKYGRNNPQNEVVHHINGDRSDNRPENILVMSAGDHSRLHKAYRKDQLDDILIRRIRQLEEELKKQAKRAI